MVFLSAWWLLGLLPWVAVLVRWLWRQPNLAAVPHLRFWKQLGSARAEAKSVNPLPLRVIFLLAAALLAIVAAGRPAIGRRPVSVTFLIGERVGTAGLQRWFGRVTAGLQDQFIAVHTFADVSADAAAPDLKSDLTVFISPTRVDRADLMVIATDAPDPIELSASGFADNPPEWMLRLTNNRATPTSATLQLETSPPTTQNILLPPIGQSRDYFVAVPVEVGRQVDVSLQNVAGDRLLMPQTVYAGPTPRLIAADGVPQALRKFCDVYGKIHQPNGQSMPILFGSVISSKTIGVVCPVMSTTEIEATNVVILQHPITHHLDPSRLKALAFRSADPPTGWQVVMRAGDRAMLAVRDGGVRQVWYGFQSSDFEKQTDFVVLMADTVEWLSDSSGIVGESKSSKPATPLPDSLKTVEQIENRLDKTKHSARGLCAASLACLAMAAWIKR